jgi:type II secretory pathway pseudopilin PulG
MKCSTFRGRRNVHSPFVPHPSSLALHASSPGFAYIALLVAIIIIGISLGAAGKYWSNVVLRDKEEELLFRGEQYRQAIEHYYNYLGKREYPQSIDDLLKDTRSATGMRHLRQKYNDPITGEDFVAIKHPVTQRIIGVHSSSDKLSLKQTGFPDSLQIANESGFAIIMQVPIQTRVTVTNDVSSQTDDSEIESASTTTIRYSDWIFASTIKEPTPVRTTPVTSPPGTRPPGTYPPGTYPPGTYPPGTHPPGTYPPGTHLPVTYPPGYQPPKARPNATRPPATRPPVTSPDSFINK